MTNDEIINIAIKELQKSEKVFLMFDEFSFLKGIEKNDPRYIRIRYMLKKSVPFEIHTEESIKLSSLGLVVANDFKDWFHYKKSLQPKKDYIKIGSLIIAFISLVWVIFQGIRNDNTKNENAVLIMNRDSLLSKTIQLKDTVSKLKIEIEYERKNLIADPEKIKYKKIGNH